MAFDPLNYLITVGKEHHMTLYFQCPTRDGFGGMAQSPYFQCQAGIKTPNIFSSAIYSLAPTQFVKHTQQIQITPTDSVTDNQVV